MNVNQEKPMEKISKFWKRLTYHEERANDKVASHSSRKRLGSRGGG